MQRQPRAVTLGEDDRRVLAAPSRPARRLGAPINDMKAKLLRHRMTEATDGQ